MNRRRNQKPLKLQRYWPLAVLAVVCLLFVLFVSRDKQPSGPEFPRSEPEYTAKRALDFSPFAEVLASITPQQIAALDKILLGKTVLQIQELLHSGELTSVTLVTWYLARIKRYDVNRLNSVMELNPDALKRAAELDAERKHGLGNGIMFGIPVLLKDNIGTAGPMHTTAGAYALKDWQVGRDAFVVSQLREAGAIILGKANLSEWANYMDPDMPNGFSTLGGQTRNPYGPYDVLGSSSGSAVAAAANFATVTVGTETQGSLIKPAEINSVVALKTSRGLVSRDNIIPLLDWMDVPGPMGRTVTDAAVLLTAMMGVDKNDPATLSAGSLAGTDFTRYLRDGSAKKLRVGLALVSEETVARYIRVHKVAVKEQEQIRLLLTAHNTLARQTGTVFTDLGLEVVEVDSAELPTGEDIEALLEFGFKDALDRFLAVPDRRMPVTSLAGIIAVNDEDLKNRAPYGQGFLKKSQNTLILPQEYAAMKDLVHTAYSKNLHTLFVDYNIDVLVTGSQEYAAAGFPAITLPAGYDEQGQPYGMTMIADFLGEPALVAAGYAYEQKTLARKEPDLVQTIKEIEETYAQ